MSTNSTYTVLLVEDDENLGFVVSEMLRMEGYQVVWMKDGDTGLKAFGQDRPHLSVLDIMLPKKDGYELAADIKAIDQQHPIIFLTARSMETDRIAGFNTGADDYITKPFSNQEFLLRLKAVLNRCYASNSTQVVNRYMLGKFSFVHSELVLSLGNVEKTLTRKEADVLKILCQHLNRTVKRDMILTALWGHADYFTGRSLDVFISRLRKYLKEDSSISIENVHGVGFRLMVG